MSNRLASETSPYLRQHADNPVDWYPWGDEALAAAREQDKPILLSIGYSACHWCHVMAHESFEDAEVATVMNKLFINIKVDREERPDLDQIYQTAHNVLTARRGGWPLTMFLLPDQTPFFGGTYFPKTARYDKPGFMDVMPQVAASYRERRGELEQKGKSLRDALVQVIPQGSGVQSLSPDLLDSALAGIKRMFDETDGGIRDPLKFPHTAEFEFCLRRAVLGDEHAMRVTTLTLTNMAERGLYDQLRGGFYRYCVDQQWEIPHFEKMLYDNGPLLALYTDLWLVDRQPLYARVVADTAAWAMREMQAPDGGYYSTLDADSEHEEGKFYVWTPEEVRGVLTEQEYAVVAPHFGLDAPPNFEHKYWHLQVVKPLAAIVAGLGITMQEAQARLDEARVKLLALRGRRVRPARDEKILTSWNALMIKGMTHASRVFDQPQWLASARSAAEFIRASLWIPDAERGNGGGRLLATYKDGKAHLNAYLDDYAFLLDALLELMQAEFSAIDLEWARSLAEVMLDRFEDREHGGFFFVSDDHEQLLHRAKIGPRSDTPSGNSVAAVALERLGHILGEPRYTEAARRTVEALAPLLETQPNAHGTLCVALEEQLTPPAVTVLTGPAATRLEWQRQLNSRYLPGVITLSIAPDMQGLPPILIKPASKSSQAWVCKGVSCLPPISALPPLLTALADRAA
jgi:uncharacterized protein YyaL (SSP411 family)